MITALFRAFSKLRNQIQTNGNSTQRTSLETDDPDDVDANDRYLG